MGGRRKEEGELGLRGPGTSLPPGREVGGPEGQILARTARARAWGWGQKAEGRGPRTRRTPAVTHTRAHPRARARSITHSARSQVRRRAGVACARGLVVVGVMMMVRVVPSRFTAAARVRAACARARVVCACA